VVSTTGVFYVDKFFLVYSKKVLILYPKLKVMKKEKTIGDIWIWDRRIGMWIVK
jgi:hypothetical protein